MSDQRTTLADLLRRAEDYRAANWAGPSYDEVSALLMSWGVTVVHWGDGVPPAAPSPSNANVVTLTRLIHEAESRWSPFGEHMLTRAEFAAIELHRQGIGVVRAAPREPTDAELHAAIVWASPLATVVRLTDGEAPAIIRTALKALQDNGVGL